jgi:hypothetical protein
VEGRVKEERGVERVREFEKRCRKETKKRRNISFELIWWQSYSQLLF